MKRLALMTIVTIVALGLALGGQQQRTQGAPALRTAPVPLTGRATFDRYCAGCHGARGRGDGPVASSLASRPPDLSKLAIRNRGGFPRDTVRKAIVNTERATAHSNGTMPVWGPIFRVFDKSQAEVDVRIDAVVAYLETLQDPPVISADIGRQLFAAYCATCHGPNARGGVIGSGIRGSAPDLTMLAARNSGVFPAEQVLKIIDGRQGASHGTREMPAWGDAFRTTKGGWTQDVIDARIKALTTYLASIQVRNGE